MVRIFRLSSTFALLVSVAGGCGGGTSSGISLDEARARVFAAVCKLNVTCGEVPDQASCLASLGESVGYSATLNADVSSGKVIYDGVKARMCVEAFERYYGAGCTQSALAAMGNPSTPACDDIVVGTVAVGGACFFTEQCASGGTCQQTDPACVRWMQCCPGTCTAELPPLPIGADCVAGQACVTGAVCSRTTPSGPMTCREPSTVEGAPCVDFLGCALALYCDIDPATSTGTCRRASATGAACSPDTFDSCDDLRDYCDEATSICARRSGIGGACDPAQLNCLGVGDCVGTTCVEKVRPGGTCSATGPSCLGSLDCDSETSTCALRPLTGACG